MKPRIAVVCGSINPASRTLVAANLLRSSLQERCLVDFLTLHDISVAHLGARFPTEVWQKFANKLKAADLIVFCTPEYNGCFSSALMALLENLGYPAIYAGKLVAVLGVAGGRIGAVKAIEHLKSVCSHCGAIVLPAALSIANSYDKFDDQGNILDETVVEEIRKFSAEIFSYLQDKESC